MKSFTYVINDIEGVHARPAGIIANEAKNSSSNVVIKCNGKSVDAKRLFGIMGLSIKCGDVVEIEVTGPNEDEDVIVFEQIFKDNL